MQLQKSKINKSIINTISEKFKKFNTNRTTKTIMNSGKFLVN